MMLTNGAAVLAIASLFTIGFASWEEVGGAGSVDFDIEAIVKDHSEKLFYSAHDSFVVYPTGIMQEAVSEANRVYTTTPYLNFYLLFELSDGFLPTSTFTNKLLLSFYTFDELDNKIELDGLTAAAGFSYWYVALNDKAVTNKDELENRISGSAAKTTSDNTCSFLPTQVFTLAKYVSLKVQWTINNTYSFKDFYTYIGSKSQLYFDLEVYGEVTND